MSIETIKGGASPDQSNNTADDIKHGDVEMAPIQINMVNCKRTAADGSEYVESFFVAAIPTGPNQFAIIGAIDGFTMRDFKDSEVQAIEAFNRHMEMAQKLSIPPGAQTKSGIITK